MNNLTKLSIFILTVILSANCYANKGYIKQGKIACLTEQTFNQLQEASSVKDYRMVEKIIKSGLCFELNKTIEVFILDYNLFSPSKVRVWIGDKPVVLYTSGSFLTTK